MLKVDRNPIEWPPPSVIETTEDLEDSEVMHKWVLDLKSWLEGKASPGSASALIEEESLPQKESVPSTPLPRYVVRYDSGIELLRCAWTAYPTHANCGRKP